MTTLTQRIITAIVLLTVVFLVMFVRPGTPTLLFFTLFLLVGLWEWSGFLRGGALIRLLYFAGGVALGLMVYAWGDAASVDWILQVAMLWWLLVAVWLYARAIRYGRLLTAIAGYLCLLPAWLALLVVFTQPQGVWRFIWLLAIIAAADIGAYFTGKRFGQRKLAPRLSPGKTIEGLAGGVLAATIVASGGGLLLDLDPLLCALCGPLLAGISVVGDLTVSAFKRNAGLKDTGWILPGHGGVMDRIDSLTAAAPFFAVILSFLRF